MLKIKKLDKIQLTKIRARIKVTDALKYVQKLKWKWAGHVARVKDQIWTIKVTFWKRPPGKRSRGRPLTHWDDEIIKTAGTNWKQIAQDRDNWADAVYVPKLWYYKELSFINDQNAARASVSNMDEKEESADEEQQIEQQHMNIENNSQPNEQLIHPNEESDNDGSIAGNSARRPKPKRTNDDNLVNSVLQSVNDHFKRPRDEVSKEDRHDIYFKSIANKLRDLPRQQRMLAEKLMNDVLHEAEWGNLTLDFKVINTKPDNQRYTTSPSINFSPSYQITSSSHSSHSASPSPNMQANQQTVSPS
ncbi:Putative uncharacterized transposon-derived protein F52C9.6 [Eumeta japonica]|uniref:Uncharacterized transposon-derived protein F52C9.6 n=1 Tax=Eumeta variegata TaxID=151549 RepID=A0A4C1XNA7_EUMVA|nr:Putative uncharacterized transposon-derived protein F52C9.6 [Eumeta japonica]